MAPVQTNSTSNDKAQVSLPSDTEVRVTRDFRAPRTLVWRAHTEPELFQRWIGGYPGWSMPVCEMDVRLGGKYRWRWRSDENGQELLRRHVQRGQRAGEALV